MSSSPVRTLTILVVTAFLLTACAVAAPSATPSVTPSPTFTFTFTPTPSATLTPTPTFTPSPTVTDTPVPSLTPTASRTYPPRPTATAYQTPSPKSGLFARPEEGFSIRYPSGWIIDTDTNNPSLLAKIYDSADMNILALVFRFGRTADTPDFSAFHKDVIKYLLPKVTARVVTDTAITLSDGQPGWTTLFTANQAKISLTSIGNQKTVFTLVVLGATTQYNANAEDINAFVGALHLQPPAISGIPRDQALVLPGGESTNPRDYDPATSHGSGDKMIFSGLVALDPEMNLIPDLAESWAVTNGITYTFKLRAEARFHNGKPVTAYDFVYAWERAADPATTSETVLTYLGDIVGVKERRAGQADHIAGLKALDDHTLQVIVDAPKPYFLLKLTYPVAFVVDRANVETGPDWYRAPNGTGPYRLVRWERFQLMLYEANKDFYLTPPAIPYVVMPLFSGNDLRLYEAGQADVAWVGLFSLPRMQDPNEPLHTELVSGVNLCTSFVTFDTRQPPFDDVKVRQAFTLAYDGQKYIDVVLRGLAYPAPGLYPPGLPGYNPEVKGLGYDPERARQLLAESKYGGPAGLPPIVYTTSGYSSDASGSVAAQVQMWQQTLGVTITVENLEPDKYQDEIDAGHHGQLVGGGWCADYPDPENFADVLFHTGAEMNRSHYSNPKVDALLEQARVEQDPAKRLALYQQIEQIILNDAPVLFTYRVPANALVKPYVKGYVLTPINISLVRYLQLDASKMK